MSLCTKTQRIINPITFYTLTHLQLLSCLDRALRSLRLCERESGESEREEIRLFASLKAHAFAKVCVCVNPLPPGQPSVTSPGTPVCWASWAVRSWCAWSTLSTPQPPSPSCCYYCCSSTTSALPAAGAISARLSSSTRYTHTSALHPLSQLHQSAEHYDMTSSSRVGRYPGFHMVILSFSHLGMYAITSFVHKGAKRNPIGRLPEC